MVLIIYTHDKVRKEDLIRCDVCKTQIGFIEDHLDNVQNGRIGVFNSVVKLVYWNDYPMIYQEQDESATPIDQVLYELGGGQIVPAQQNGLTSVGPAPMDEDEEAVDQIVDGMGNLDLNQHMY